MARSLTRAREWRRARMVLPIIGLLLLSLLVGCRDEGPTQISTSAPGSVQLIALGGSPQPAPLIPFESMAVDGVLAFAVTRSEVAEAAAWAGLHVFNISAPSTPWVVSFVPIAGARTVSASGGYAYVGTPSGVKILDVREPSSVRLLSTFGSDQVAEQELSGTTLVLGLRGGAIDLVDVSDPDYPARLSRFQSGLSDLRGIAFSGDRIGITGVPNALLVFDAGNPRSVLPLARFEGVPTGYLDDQEVLFWSPVRDGIVYGQPHLSGSDLVVGALGGYAVYDASASPPRQHAVASLRGSSHILLAEGNLLFVGSNDLFAPASQRYTVKIFEKSNPFMPREVGSASLARAPISVLRSGGYLFVSTDGDGLRVFRMQ